MDLPQIGAHCSLDSCKDLDFLPITCPSCGRRYCRHHVSPDAHSCPSLTSTTPLRKFDDKLQRCELPGCQKRALSLISEADDVKASAVCPQCSKAFCADHRHPSSHACVSAVKVAETPAKGSAARALLAKNFPKTLSGTVAKAPVIKPRNRSQVARVEAMRLRHRAVPVDPRDTNASIAVDQRLHISAAVADASLNLTPFWLRKDITTGKVLDLLAARLKVNGTVSLSEALCVPDRSMTRRAVSQPVYLLKMTDECDHRIQLRNSVAIGEHVHDGDVLLVSREPMSTEGPETA
ncbi:hypothetical protein FISHEDRAFT_38384 [Fistulina hepatica ATCC 64428]|nr:hypothetical protein FISHEDRAFT_38384 [Fistulina hepatica ATCC 64428]